MIAEKIVLRPHHLVNITKRDVETQFAGLAKELRDIDSEYRDSNRVTFPIPSPFYFFRLLKRGTWKEFRNFFKGFRLTYDKDTITRIVDYSTKITANPNTVVEIGEPGKPDSICSLCSNYDGHQCTLYPDVPVFKEYNDEQGLKAYYKGWKPGQRKTIKEIMDVNEQRKPSVIHRLLAAIFAD